MRLLWVLLACQTLIIPSQPLTTTDLEELEDQALETGLSLEDAEQPFIGMASRDRSARKCFKCMENKYIRNG